MKKQLQKIIIGCLISLPMISNAQWGTIGGTVGRTVPSTITGIGIGTFPSAPSLQAKLQVNSFLLGSNPATDGFLFRTDGSQAFTNRWDLYTGTSSTALQQRYSLFVDASTATSPFMVNHQANYGHMQFITSDGSGATNLSSRMRINGYSTGHSYNGFAAQTTTGFVGISADPTYWTDVASPQTPVSLLHLVGDVSGHNPFAYRPWMKDGISFTLGRDQGFIGPRMVNDVTDVMEFVVGWGDNPSTSSGPDVLSFRFLAGEGGGGTDLAGEDMDGREVMRMTGNGNVGIGPNFSSTNMPKADLHINTTSNDPLNPGNTDARVQMTIKDIIGESATDGFHVSVDQMNGNETGTAFLRQYENRSIRVISSINTSGTTLGERMRISSVSDPITTNPSSYFATNTTRIGIPSDGATPLTNIRSVLHIGSNLPVDNDGWRRWMNVGTLSTDKGHNAYFGIGDAIGGASYQSANIAWGAGSYQTSNDGINASNMPLRFVFASDFSSGSSTDIHTQDGREVARINSNGRMGIGNAAPNNRLVLDSKSIDPYYAANNTSGGNGSSGLRFIRMNTNSTPMENPGEGVLSVDANGDVIYVEDGGAGICEWDESGTGLYMGIPGACHPGNTGIGSIPFPNTKLYVSQNEAVSGATGIQVNTSGNSLGAAINYGVRAVASCPENAYVYGVHALTTSPDKSFAGYFHADLTTSAASSVDAIGCQGIATSSLSNAVNIGVQGNSGNGKSNTGVMGSAISLSNSTGGTGVAGIAIDPVIARGVQGIGQAGNASATCYGVYGWGRNGQTNYGVYGNATGGTTNWAVWSQGQAYSTGGWLPSDQNLKENINEINNATQIIFNLNPAAYNFRTEQYAQLNLPEGQHYGVISQQLEEVLPDLVKETTYPAQYDSLGNVISEAVTFKAVNYNELIPILIAGFKEQQSKINSMQEQINGCCSAHGDVTPDSPGMPMGNPQHQQNITLTNADKAMLGFASPNPNKGEVYVDYYIPTSHKGTAEMLFTDATGRPVQNVLITGKGNGRLNIDTATLAAGQYQYTLIVDGEIIATRKMIRE